MTGMELTSGAIGVVCQQLYDATEKVKARCSEFPSTLESQEKRINLLTPKIEEMDRLNQKLEDYPRQEIGVFLQQLEKARDLVNLCVDIPSWNLTRSTSTKKRLWELDSSFEKLSRVQLQAAQDIKRLMLEVVQMNRKLDKMNLHELVSSSSSSSSSSADWFENEMRFGIRLRSAINKETSLL